AGRPLPGVLTEQEQIAPHFPARRGPLLDPLSRAAARRLGLLVPQGEQVRSPGDQLGRAITPELRRRRCGAVLAIAPGVAAPHRQLRAPAPLDVAEEVLRARGDEPGIGAAREIAHTARREQGGEGEALPRHVAQLCCLIAQSVLAREQARGPDQARERLVVEDPRQWLCEQGREADLAVAERPRERLT